MQETHQYSLEKGSKKQVCPECNKKTFVFYVDMETNEYLPARYGRCDRESKCNYHLNPYKDGYAKDQVNNENHIHTPPTKTETVYFNFEAFKQTLKPERYNNNTFVQNLLQRVQFPFDDKDVAKVIELYCLGTIASGYRAGAITFPFIDIKGNIRAVQVKQFDDSNHTTGTDFLHSIIEKHHTENKTLLPAWLEAYKKNDKYVSCLFGEHLLSKYPNNPIALVEAPKTAIYGTLYFGTPKHPKDFIWIAVYNKSSFSIDRLKVLKGRTVYVFPDLSKDGSTFKEWETKANEYQKLLSGTTFVFSDLLEKLATVEQKDSGADIADNLIKLDWRLFRKTQVEVPPVIGVKSEPAKVTPEPIELIPEKTEPEPLPTLSEIATEPETSDTQNKATGLIEGDWSETINILETYFLNIQLPNTPIKLNPGATITDVPLFIQTHLRIVKANNGKRVCRPYLNRLQQLKQLTA